MAKERRIVSAVAGFFSGSAIGALASKGSATTAMVSGVLGMACAVTLEGSMSLYYHLTCSEETRRMIAANQSMHRFLEHNNKPNKNVETLKQLVAKLRNKISEDSIPKDYMCPIGHRLMFDPVLLPDQHNYERGEIFRWYLEGHTHCPLNPNVHFADPSTLPTNTVLQAEIINFLQEQLDNISGQVPVTSIA